MQRCSEPRTPRIQTSQQRAVKLCDYGLCSEFGCWLDIDVWMVGMCVFGLCVSMAMDEVFCRLREDIMVGRGMKMVTLPCRDLLR